MNTRRNVLYLLLALLLVFSQQMGYSHALTHAATVAGVVHAAEPLDEGDADIVKLGIDHNCAQCMAFAQIATAVDTRFYSFPLAAVPSTVVAPAPAPLDCRRTACAFHSRGPPVAA